MSLAQIIFLTAISNIENTTEDTVRTIFSLLVVKNKQ